MNTIAYKHTQYNHNYLLIKGIVLHYFAKQLSVNVSIFMVYCSTIFYSDHGTNFEYVTRLKNIGK